MRPRKLGRPASSASANWAIARDAASFASDITTGSPRSPPSRSATLSGIDALIFTGGIGENSRLIRTRICERLGWMGIDLDQTRNAANERMVSSDLARTTVLVIPTNEELVIARVARAVIGLKAAA